MNVKLATGDGKEAKLIAAEFGVEEQYVLQRMGLSNFAKPIKAALREGKIGNGTAEVLAALPKDRQLEVWKEVGESGTNRRNSYGLRGPS